MEKAWQRIVAWFAANTPAGTLRLPQGAEETSIRAAEREIGFTLPADLRTFYRLHDGLGGASLLHYGSFHSVAGMVDAWQAHRRLEKMQRAEIASGGWVPAHMAGPIRPVWWSSRRAFITNIGGTDGVMVDVEPAPGGAVGQLIEFNHELGPQCVLAPTFTTWLQRIAAGLEAGKFECDPYGTEVVPHGYYAGGQSLNDWDRDSSASTPPKQ